MAVTDRVVRLGAMLGTVAAAVVGAQTQQTSPPTFRAGVDVVELDVSVFDKDRHPIRGLKAGDFTILEDGKPQSLVAFSAVDYPDPPPVTAAWMTRAPADVDSNDLSRGRLFVILLDDDNIRNVRTAPHDFEALRVLGRRVIDNLGPDDLATVVYSHDNWDGQGFTADRGRLHAAIDRLVTSPRPNLPSKHVTECDFLLVLEEVIDDLAVIQHRRKVVVDISTATTCRARMLTAGNAGNVIDRANAADINVYTIDAAGLRPDGTIGDTPTTFLQSLAENTGGRAIINTNTPQDQVPTIFDENKSYYLLGYESHNLKTRESLKRIEVKVNRPDVTVRTQTVYDAPAPPGATKPKPDPPPDAKAILDVVPKADLPLKATAAAFADATGKGAVVAVVVNVGVPAGTSSLTDTFDVVIRAFTPDGRPQGEAHQITSMAADAAGPQRAEILSRLPLKPGRYNLRVAAHGKNGAPEGSVYTDVIVPDFAKDAVSLSGLILSATPGLRAAPREVVMALMPVLPTAERTFDRAQQVSTFVRVYQGGSGPPENGTIHVKVVDDHDVVMMDRSIPLPAAAFAQSRSADYRYTLASRDWHPGAYLVAVSAVVGSHTVTREVRIDFR